MNKKLIVNLISVYLNLPLDIIQELRDIIIFRQKLFSRNITMISKACSAMIEHVYSRAILLKKGVI